VETDPDFPEEPTLNNWCHHSDNHRLGAMTDHTWTRRGVVTTLAAAAMGTPFLPRGRSRSGANEGDVVLRFTSHVSRSHGFYPYVFTPFFQIVEEETQGRLRIEPMMDGLLHGALDGFKASVTGLTDYTHGYTTYQPGSFHLMHGLQLPFIFPDSPVASLVAEELYPRFFKEEYEAMGVYLATCDSTSPYQVISRDPVLTLEDLDSLKIRTTGGIVAEIYRELGAVPVVMAAAEVYPALQRGIIDAVSLGVPDIASYRLQEIGKFLTRVNLNVTVLQYCLNPRSFDELPEDIRETFYRLLRVRSQMAAQDYYSGPREEASYDALRAGGCEVLDLEPAERERWREALVPLRERFISENEAQGRPAREMLAEMEALSAKYSALSRAEIRRKVVDDPVMGIIDL
jgi:TRAP-type C4-dicarboxylate transport system substrate-binding protein